MHAVTSCTRPYYKWRYSFSAFSVTNVQSGMNHFRSCRPSILPLLPLPLLLLLCRAPVMGYEIVDSLPNGTDLLQNCSHSFVLLSDADNYTLLENGTALTFQGDYYNVSFYESSSNSSGPVICMDTPDNDPSSSPLILALHLTVVSLSIIASIALLITYSLFRKLRTLPGKVIMNLMASFLAGDVGALILFVLLSEAWFQILVGYFFYARFMWMALAGFEICRNIYAGIQLTHDPKGKKNKLLVAYILIGWGVPILPTIITAVVHYTSSDPEMQRLFGIAGYVTYLVPIGFMVLFNAGAVIFLSIALRKAAIRQRQFNNAAAKKHSTNYGRVFVIILTVLGLTWVSLFAVLTKTDNVILITIIMLVNASQPIFVCIAFVGTKKVIQEYLRLCGCRKKVTGSSLSQEQSQSSMV